MHGFAIGKIPTCSGTFDTKIGMSSRSWRTSAPSATGCFESSEVVFEKPINLSLFVLMISGITNVPFEGGNTACTADDVGACDSRRRYS